VLHSTTFFSLPNNSAGVGVLPVKALADIKKRLPSRIRTSSFAIDPGLRFVLEEPGLLRLALDSKEVQVVLEICDQKYANACINGRLLSSNTGRDYFEPILRYHSFWDVLRFRLQEEVKIRDAEKMQLLEELLEAVADILESEVCPETSLSWIFEEAHAFGKRLFVMDNTSPRFLTAFGKSIGEAVALEFSRFGNYCRGRIRDKHVQIEQGHSRKLKEPGVAGISLV
jgi:hypothetical protein